MSAATDVLIGWHSQQQADMVRQQRCGKHSGAVVYSRPDGGEAVVTEVRRESGGPSLWPDARRVGVVVSYLREA